MPATDTKSAGMPIRRTRRRSVSMPVSSSSMRMPSCATASIMPCWLASGGKTAAWRSGSSAPKTVGPSTMPARSWPITAGWPMRCISSPPMRPAAISSATSMRKMTSESGGVGGGGSAAAQATPPAASATATARNRKDLRIRRPAVQLLRTGDDAHGRWRWRARRPHARYRRWRAAAAHAPWRGSGPFRHGRRRRSPS